jgi:hypothetical protein
MQKNHVTKAVVYGIIVLIIGASTIPAIHINPESKPDPLHHHNSVYTKESTSDNSPMKHSAVDTNTPSNGGWLEEKKGVKILHLNGSYYEMGYSHGFLLKEEIHANMRILFSYFNEMGFSYTTLRQSWEILKNHIPEKFTLELQGIADGSNSSMEEIGIYNVLHDIANFISCSGAIVWGSATSDGNLIHIRSTDHGIFLHDPDPETGSYLQENQVLIVRNPMDDFASMSPMWAGRIGSWGGINEKGIAVSETTCWTSDTTLQGMCAAFRMGLVLDTAKSSDEAITILNENKTVGWNLLVSDSNLPAGYVLEQTANISSISTWDDSVENTKPFYKIEDVLRRTNCFLSAECAAVQRDIYNPRSVRSLIRFLLGRDVYFGAWKHYVSLSRGIERYRGSLDLHNSMTLLRECYTGKYDLFFSLLQKLHVFSPMHQWVADPKTGDMLICFASKDRIASLNPVHHFNLFTLLESKPPIPYTEDTLIEMIHQVNKSIILKYHDGLMAFGARYTGSENCSLAGEYIYQSFEELGLDVMYHEWDFGGYQSRNIVATLPRNNPDSTAVFILCAHYDCSEGSVGANDDGSGVAGMLAIAEIMSTYSFHHTIRFIAFSGEEVGTYGSFTYARDAYNSGENIVAVINVDMIGYAVTPEGGNRIRFMHPERSTWVFDFAETISDEYYDFFSLSVESKPNHRGADHQAFVDFGYDGVWVVHHDIYPWCNTPQDTPEKLNWSYLVNATKFLIALLAEIADKPIDVQVLITAPLEGYLYVLGVPLFQFKFLRTWYSGMRGITVLLGSALAKVHVISDEEIDHVIFCLDDDFRVWDADPPYEWNIIGWPLPIVVGRHNLRVFAYTTSGEIAYDEMDLFILTKPQYKGKWPPAQPCNPTPENGAVQVPKNTTLSWDGGDYDPGDVVTYDVYFGTNPDPPFIDQIGPFAWDDVHIVYTVTPLQASTRYYWKIVATDMQGASSHGPLWSFTTI